MAIVLNMQENFDKVDSFDFDQFIKTRVKNIIKTLYDKEGNVVIVGLFEDGIKISLIEQFYDTIIVINFKV